MAFQMLGGVAGPDGGALRPQSARLLALLLSRRGRTVSIQTIEDTVWRGELVDAAAVHTAVSRLRSQLSSGSISRAGDGYRLDVAEHGCDADDFERHLDEADRAASPASALDAAERALRAWSGSPFGTYGSEPSFLAETSRLLDRHAHAVEVRAAALLRLERFDEVLDALAIPMADHPFHEGLRALHVRALARCGRRVEALRELDQYRRRLADETGLTLSDAIVALERELLTDQPVPPRLEPPDDRRLVGHVDSVSFGIRRAERSALRQLAAAASSGLPAVALLSGDPGAGKTHLVTELRELARLWGWRTISGRTGSSNAVALGGWGALGIEARRDAPVSETAVRRSRLIEAFVDRLTKACDSAPVLVVLEDFHWADDVSLDALAAAYGMLDAQRLLIVVTSRTSGLDDVDRPELARLARDPAVTHLRLGRLDSPDVATMVADVLGRPLSAGVLHELERRSEGSPLLLRLLCEQMGETESLDEIPVPADLRSPYAGMIRSLPPHSIDLVTTAALLGGAPSLSLLSEISNVDASRVRSDLAPACEVGLVHLRDDVVSFDHDLAQRSAVGELAGSERQARHCRIAERLLEATPDPAGASDARVELVASQLLQAGLLAQRDALSTWLIASGTRAAAGSLWRDAARYFHAALDAGASEEWRLRLGEAQYMALDPAATATLAAAADLARDEGVPGVELEATLLLHRQAYNRRGDRKDADRRLADVLDRTTRRDDRLRVLAQLAEVAVDRSDPLATKYLDEAEQLLADDAPIGLRFQLQFSAGLAALERLDLEEAASRFERAIALDWRDRVGEPAIRLAGVHLITGRPAGALALLSDSLERSLLERRFHWELALLYAFRAQAHATCGALATAESDVAKAARWAKLAGADMVAGLTSTLLFWVASRSGRPEPTAIGEGLAELAALPPSRRPPNAVVAWLERLVPRLRVSYSGLTTLALVAELACSSDDARFRSIIASHLDRASSLGVVCFVAWPSELTELRTRLSGHP